MYSKILVPLDGSKLGECSLAHVQAIAKGCGLAEVVLLTVTEEVLPVVVWNYDQSKATEETERNREIVRRKAEEYLKGIKQGLEGTGLGVQSVIFEGTSMKSPAEVILDYAAENKVDLIVISTHGRSGVTRWAFGSVAERVVRYSIIPVLTITPAGCRTG